MRVLDAPLYPFLLAVYPILQLRVDNMEWLVTWDDLIASVALSLIVAVVGWMLFSRLLARRLSRGEATLLWVLFWLWYGPFVQFLVWLTERPRLDLYTVALPVWLLGVLAGGMIIHRRDWVRGGTRFLNLFGVFLLLFPIIAVLKGALSRPRPTEIESLPGNFVEAPPESLPDVYFLVLDGYSSTRSLAETRGFDNRLFEDSLRQRGFFVPTNSRTNYVYTHLSLASMLNWTHLQKLERNAGNSRDRTYTYDMIENNRAARFLQSLGYEFVFFPTTWGGTVQNRLADRQIPDPPLRKSNLHLIWFWQTPASPFIQFMCWAVGCQPKRFPYPPETAKEFKLKFTRLTELAGEPGPKFILAHLLLPHPPYIFRADCTEREAVWPFIGDPASWRTQRTDYLDQVNCLNSLVLKVIDPIIHESDHPPVIILQSDHGSGASIGLHPMTGETIPFEELSQEQIDDRIHVFAAYYLPNGGDKLLYDSITPVNILPIVFNHYFQTNIPLDNDATYWSDYLRPYVFRRVAVPPPPPGLQSTSGSK
ncbi:MAG: hypothetical protein ACREX3_04660 [Gammaproteobacteria bacterium]